MRAYIHEERHRGIYRWCYAR